MIDLNEIFYHSEISIRSLLQDKFLGILLALTQLIHGGKERNNPKTEICLPMH
jgi:hypothetical protein